MLHSPTYDASLQEAAGRQINLAANMLARLKANPFSTDKHTKSMYILQSGSHFQKLYSLLRESGSLSKKIFEVFLEIAAIVYYHSPGQP